VDTGFIGNKKQVGKVKIKNKVKLHDGNKKSSFLRAPKLEKPIDVIEPEPIIDTPPQPKSRHKKYWILVIIVIILAGLIWYLSQTWLIQSTFFQAKTYSKASIFGTNVGNLSSDQLSSQLARLKTEFEAHKITLVNDKQQWSFDANKLGVIFDAKTTSQSVLKLNKLSITDKYQLLTGGINPATNPTILVNNDTCVKALAVIPSVQIDAKDALVYFDMEIKIKPDQPGTKFNAVSTCSELAKKLSANLFTQNVSLDVIQANLTKASLDPKLAQIQSTIGKSLSLKSSSGNYQLDLTSEQLLALFEISKNDSGVQVGWSSTKLDELVNDIASKVNSYDSSPALGTCQYLSSGGGYWLDKEATKKIFTDLGADSARLYTLPIIYHAPVIGTRTPLSHGNSGTVFLTYDDGLIYGDRIMNLAACYGIKVTFFELGSRVGVDAAPLRRAIAEGHAVQSHGTEHAMYDYGDRSYDWQYGDINQSISSIMSVTGVRPTYFRPPGGNRSDNTYKAAAANGINLILWGASSADSSIGGISTATTCANVLAGAYPGASVLMHSTKSTTAEALPCIAEGLAARGYNMQALR